MRKIIMVGVMFFTFGCGTNLDSVSGNASLNNGTLQGTATINTPFGPLTFGTLASPSPSPSTFTSPSVSPVPATSPSPL